MQELQLAGCILLNEQGDILLLHRNTDKYNHWEVPGGKVESGESASDAAIRELREELGVDVEIIRELGAASFVDGRPMHYRWFLAKTDGAPKICELDKFDDIAYFAPAALREGRLSLSEGAKRLTSLVQTGEVSL